MADLAGAETPADWNCGSLVAWLDNPPFAWKDLAVCEHYSDHMASGIAMIRQGA